MYVAKLMKMPGKNVRVQKKVGFEFGQFNEKLKIYATICSFSLHYSSHNTIIAALLKGILSLKNGQSSK